jgi:hypothetical protein
MAIATLAGNRRRQMEPERSCLLGISATSASSTTTSIEAIRDVSIAGSEGGIVALARL